MKADRWLMLCLWTWVLSVTAQPNPSDFLLSGETQIVADDCLQLTPDQLWSSGGIWYKEPIDLSESFRIDLKLMMGCQDATGADGMVFVFSPYPTASGYQGEGMGFAGLQPSLGVEVDTWQNEHLGDPSSDHVAIMRDGYVSHFYNLAGPIPIPNVEDCALHSFSLIWDGAGLSLELDGNTVVSHAIDAVHEIFYDDPMVYMGVTAATGRYTNRHEICFERIEVGKPIRSALFSRVVQSKLKHGLIQSIDLEFDEKSAIVEGEEALYKLINLLKRVPNQSVEIDIHVKTGQGPDEDLRLAKERAQTIKALLQSEGIEDHRVAIRPLGSQFDELQERAIPKLGRVEIRLFKPKT